MTMSSAMSILSVSFKALEVLGLARNGCHARKTKRAEMCVERVNRLPVIVREDGGGDEFRGNFHITKCVDKIKFLKKGAVSKGIMKLS